MREKLFDIYRNELEYYGFQYVIISGTGHERFRHCVNAVDSILNEMKKTHYENE